MRDTHTHPPQVVAGSLIVGIIVGLYFGVIGPLLFPPSLVDGNGVEYIKDASGRFVAQ